MNGYLTRKQKWRKCYTKNHTINCHKDDEYIPCIKSRKLNIHSSYNNEFENKVIKVQGNILHQKKVSFQNTVYVCLIPTKEEYNWFSL